MFSNATKYAIRGILYLSTLKNEQRATVEELAKELELPKPYLSKLLQRMSQHNIINSQKGRGGGFYLTKDNLGRPLIDVVHCFDGNNIMKECVLGLRRCSDNNPCVLHTNYKEFRTNLEQSMVNKSLKDLIKEIPKHVKH